MFKRDMIKLTDMKTRNRFLACFSLVLDKKNNPVEEADLENLRAQYPYVKMVYANTEGKECLGNF